MKALTKRKCEIEFEVELESALVIYKVVHPSGHGSSVSLNILFPVDGDIHSEKGRLILKDFIFAAQYALDHPADRTIDFYQRPDAHDYP